MYSKSFQTKRAFSLLELIFALGLLAVGIFSIMAAFSLSMKAASRSARTTEATLILQRLIDEQKIKGYDISIVPPVGEEDTKVPVPFDTNNKGFYYTIEVLENDEQEKWVKKRVTVFWDIYTSQEGIQKTALCHHSETE